MSIRRRLLTVFCALVVLATACQGSGDPAPGTTSLAPVTPRWEPVTLPVPPGAAGRLILRDVTVCGDRWYVVGGLSGAAGATSPAAWTSVDGRSWQALRLTARTYYGAQNVLYSVACRNGRAAAIGAKSGGVHGNPRVSTWRQLPDASLLEVPGTFELYGGADAVNVARIAAGTGGWMIAGNRVSGAAVWVSADAGQFRLIAGAPGLASDEAGRTWAYDVTAVPVGWLVVGGVAAGGRIDSDAAVWTSTDGTSWRRAMVADGPRNEELRRVTVVGDGWMAVGLSGDRFGAWWGGPDGWDLVGRFGSASGVPAVESLTGTSGRLVVALAEGGTRALWTSADRGRTWSPLTTPVALPAGGEGGVAVAAGAGGLFLVADDGTGRAWLAAV